MSKEFYSIEEIEKYYDEVTNTYVFEENGEYIDLVVFNFDLNINANIKAFDISARDVSARDIKAHNIIANDIRADSVSARNINTGNIIIDDINADDINAWNISACNISADNINYNAVCFAYNNIFCKSIKGRRKNAKHFVLDGVLEVEE